ncbi:MAG: N-6 DNA methylase [bacterium]|nr:N-6 DNA methylase [bacterium]
MINSQKFMPVVTMVGEVPEGYVIDLLTGKPVSDTPEEYIRQNIEKALIHQYRYASSDCKPEFTIKMGSVRRRVDIVVFSPSKEHRQENALILIETKRAGTNPNNKKEGIEQLKSYMAACVNAQFGMWTNGDERFCFSKTHKGGIIDFSEILDIPSFGQSVDEAYRPRRQDLMPATADNLLFTFRRCHNYIAAAEGLQKTEAFWEFLKVIFCKIEDERSSKIDFYVTPDELNSSTQAAPAKARIQNIMTQKVIGKYSQIFSLNERDIHLKPNSIAYVVGQLQRYSLLASPVDVKGIAYEEIVGSNLRGDRGEFFTPRNACRMAVQMLDPQPFERLLDPACGTGGFLITAMNHALDNLEEQETKLWINPENPTSVEIEEKYRKRNNYLSGYVFGLDLNPSLVRASKMNMVMNNDGEGNLFQVDTLANPHTWNPKATEKTPLGSIDVLFSNPPFGANIVIDDTEILTQYDLAAFWDQTSNGTWVIRTDESGRRILQKSQPPEILFIERCVQFLKEGTGRMAMVIPNGILNNPALGYVRQWIQQNTQVIAIVDMARELFQPKNDTQTSIVLMRRLNREERFLASENKLQYSIFMAVTEKIGHDKRGNTIYRQTPDGNDLIILKKEKIQKIDHDTGKLIVTDVEVKDRLIDDELPEVADAYLQWVGKK